MALRDIILSSSGQVNETVKYKMPCFAYGNKAMCYLWKDKKTSEPYVLFVDGNKLEHALLETGDRKRMKIFRVNPNEDIEIEILQELLLSAISLYEKPD
jgi:hypothetical protein